MEESWDEGFKKWKEQKAKLDHIEDNEKEIRIKILEKRIKIRQEIIEKEIIERELDRLRVNEKIRDFERVKEKHNKIMEEG